MSGTAGSVTLDITATANYSNEMPFVKIDCGILDSSLWVDQEARTVFLTALLMAVPFEVIDPEPQLATSSLNETGFIVPPGWYGFVGASGPGIVRRAGLELEPGMDALHRLGSPDKYSRSEKFEGRRLARVSHGYIALNYDEYRMRDYTAAERMRRYRARKAQSKSSSKTRQSE